MQRLLAAQILSLPFLSALLAADPVVPIFKDGEAQVVDGFKDSDFWIRHDLWVETEFDTDGDGNLDRMHVSVSQLFFSDSDTGSRECYKSSV